MALGELHLAAGHSEAARIEFAGALQRAPESFEAHLGMSRAWAAGGNAPEAESECRRAIELRPEDWRGHFELGLQFFHRGEFGRAAEAWRRVTELAPDLARGWHNLGGALYRLDRLEEATAHFRKSTEIYPSALAYGNLGTALYYLGRHEEAIAALQRATDLSPLDPLCWGNLGNTFRWIPGHEADSARALDKAIALGRDFVEHNPEDVRVRARFAGWLANRGRGDEARAAIRRSLDIAPHNPECMVRAGHVYFQLGDRSEALHWIREAVRHGYGIAELSASRELAPLKEDPDFRRILEEAPPPRTRHRRSPRSPITRGGRHGQDSAE